MQTIPQNIRQLFVRKQGDFIFSKMYSSLVKIVALEGLLLFICLLGDHLLTNPVTKQPLLRALTDSLTHGLVGGVSWAVVTDVSVNGQQVAECFFCMGLAMAVDLDHFIAAKSLHLKEALSLEKRPFFHATTLIFLLDALILVLSVITRTRSLQLLVLIFTLAWLSHHVRDSVRRGLWLPPFGETQPLSKMVYLTVILLLPLLFKFLYIQWKSHPTENTLHYQYNIV